MSAPIGKIGLANPTSQDAVIDQFSERKARQARNQRVYISGIRGQQSLEVGVSYYYRGHYLYSAAAANPIDPIPFSTRKGISVVGIAQHLAPLYVPQAADLVTESSIGALHRAQRHAWADQQAQEEALKAETAIALQEEADKKKSEEGEIPTIGTVTAPSMPSMTAFAPNPPALIFDHSFTPHDRAQYLAASAPGSRLVSVTNTPHSSRPVSPAHHASSRSLLRTIASTSRLSQMLASRDSVGQRFSPLSDVDEGRAHHCSSTAEHSPVLDTVMVANALTEWLSPVNTGIFDRVISRPSSSSTVRPRSSEQERDDGGVEIGGLGLQGGRMGAESSSSPAARLVEDDDEYGGISLQALGHHSTLQRTSRTQTPDPPFDATIRRPSQTDLAQASASDTRPFNPPIAPKALRHLYDRNTSGPTAAFSPAATPRTPSPFPPLTSSTPTNPLYLPGLGQTTPQTIPLSTNPTHRRGSSLSRPRAASIALNSAYNARRPALLQGLTLQDSAIEDAEPYKPMCTLHGETCDGETVTHLHHTEQVRRERGFKETYPLITAMGRTMVDWAGVLKEEKAKMGG